MLDELPKVLLVGGLMGAIVFWPDFVRHFWPGRVRIRITPAGEIEPGDARERLAALYDAGFVRFGIQHERVPLSRVMASHALVHEPLGVWANLGRGKGAGLFFLSVFPDGATILTSDQQGEHRLGDGFQHLFQPGKPEEVFQAHLAAIARFEPDHGRPVASDDPAKRVEAARHAYLGPLGFTQERGFKVRTAIFFLGVACAACGLALWLRQVLAAL